MELDHAKVPDPVARAMGNLIEKLNKMSVRMEEIEERHDCFGDKVKFLPRKSGAASPICRRRLWRTIQAEERPFDRWSRATQAQKGDSKLAAAFNR
jgi:hypothetical protein